MLCTVLTAIALCAIVIGSGCGGSTNHTAKVAGLNNASTTTQKKELTDAKLIAATDSACRRIHTKLASYDISTIAQLGSVASELSDYEGQVVAGLDKLTPSTSLTSDWKQIVANLHILVTNRKHHGLESHGSGRWLHAGSNCRNPGRSRLHRPGAGEQRRQQSVICSRFSEQENRCF